MNGSTAVDRLGPTDHDRLDDWFDLAMKDESVRPYLTTGVHFPRLTIPEDDYDGVVFMDKSNNGVLKLYNEEESQTMKIGIWVLSPAEGDPSRGVTALSLMKSALVVAEQNPSVNFFGTRVMSTNQHGLNFSTRLLTQWGIESSAVYDTSNSQCFWADWVHFRSPLANVRQSMHQWERDLTL